MSPGSRTSRRRLWPGRRRVLRFAALDDLPRPAWDLIDVDRYRGVLACPARLSRAERRHDARLPVPLQLVRETDLRTALRGAIGR